MSYIARLIHNSTLWLVVSISFAAPMLAQELAQEHAQEHAQVFAQQADLPMAIHGLPNAGIVSPQLLRSAQPTSAQFAALKKAGVKTIINLRDGPQDIESERAIVEQLGMHYVSIPMSSFKPVRQSSVQAFLKTVEDPKNQPALVHCRDGQDRTGTLVAIYRMRNEGWTCRAAYQEMLNYGFHPELVTLDQAVVDVSKGTGEPIMMPTFTEMANDVQRRFDNFYQRNFSSSRMNGFNTNF